MKSPDETRSGNRATITGASATNCRSWELFANGCAGGAVLRGEFSQQLLFAQHPGSQAFSLADAERMHDAIGGCALARVNATRASNDITALLNIREYY
jgi:hypothetical protein